jgi:hypothetical protein
MVFLVCCAVCDDYASAERISDARQLLCMQAYSRSSTQAPDMFTNTAEGRVACEVACLADAQAARQY